jgi:hypothetical protein
LQAAILPPGGFDYRRKTPQNTGRQRVRAAENGQKQAKTNKKCIKPQENCGNPAFSIDFAPLKAAL